MIPRLPVAGKASADQSRATLRLRPQLLALNDSITRVEMPLHCDLQPFGRAPRSRLLVALVEVRPP